MVVDLYPCEGVKWPKRQVLQGLNMTVRFDHFEVQPEPLQTAFQRVNSTDRPRHGFYRKVVKRALDVCVVVAAAPVILPVIGVLAGLVALDGGKPFYAQQRVGKEGRHFKMWKLRSMVSNADAKLADLLASDPAAKAEWDHTQKLRKDPRITRFGRLLRKTSLDELPQLWNVLTGEMSLVGPRPMMPSQTVLYPGTSYYALRPGITGLWQISGRNDTSFAARADFDASYDANLGLIEDLRILNKTFSVVVRGTGC